MSRNPDVGFEGVDALERLLAIGGLPQPLEPGDVGDQPFELAASQRLVDDDESPQRHAEIRARPGSAGSCTQAVNPRPGSVSIRSDAWLPVAVAASRSRSASQADAGRAGDLFGLAPRAVVAHAQPQVPAGDRQVHRDASGARALRDAVTDRVLDEWLEDEGRHLVVESIGLHVDIDSQTRPEAQLLESEVVSSEVPLVRQIRGIARAFIEGVTKQRTQSLQRLARGLRILLDQARQGVQGIEQKVRLDLGAKRLELGFRRQCLGPRRRDLLIPQQAVHPGRVADAGDQPVEAGPGEHLPGDEWQLRCSPEIC